jgi:TM2 domain-containing membrane protein YozV
MYGTGPSDTDVLYGTEAGLSKQPRPKKPNFKAIFLCFLLPCITFGAVSWLLASIMAAVKPVIVLALLGMILLCVFLTWYLVVKTMRRYNVGLIDFPLWYIFMAASATVAYAAAMWLGRVNYYNNTVAFEAINSLAFVSGVDPSQPSARYLDIGSVVFVPTSAVGVSQFVGFKNGDVYCVAPIINNATSTSKTASTPVSYDYWAIGLNCCSGGSFKCGEYNNPKAHSGMRLMKEEQRAFYQLAVQEAVATYSLTVNTPMFFYWIQDATAALNIIEAQGTSDWMMSMLSYTVTQLFFTVSAAILSMWFGF